MERTYQNTDKTAGYSRVKTEIAADLREVAEMLENGIAHLHPAATAFAEIYNEQESKKLNLMKAASMIEVDGEKIKTSDFIMDFNELLTTAVDKVLSTAKNSMKMTAYLNAAIDGLGAIKNVVIDRADAKSAKRDLAAFIAQISVDLATCQEILKGIVCLDIDETLDVQGKLGALLEGFSRRNMQLVQMTGNPPLSTRRMEEALGNVMAELKSARLAKYKIDKLLTKINEEGE